MPIPQGLNFLMRQEVDAMFTMKWRPIAQRNNITPNLAGNYMIAFSESDLTGQVVQPEDVTYVGESKQRDGVRKRIDLFVKAAEDGKTPHSGGKTLRRLYYSDMPLSKCNTNRKLYFVVCTFPCNVDKATRTPADLLVIGKVCLLELELMAYIKHYTGCEPACNSR